MNETTTPVAAQSPGDLFEPPAIEWLGSWDELTASAGVTGPDDFTGSTIST
jgi:hypothetical protein